MLEKIIIFRDRLLKKLRSGASPKAQMLMNIVDVVSKPGGLATLQAFKKIIKEEKERRKSAGN